MKTKKEIIEELKYFELEIPDGFYKEVLVYHHAVRFFIIDLIEEQKEEFKSMVEGMKETMDDTHICGNNDGECVCECYMKALDDLLNKL